MCTHQLGPYTEMTTMASGREATEWYPRTLSMKVTSREQDQDDVQRWYD